MRASERIKYYSDKRVRDMILELAKNREVVPKFSNGSFGERPQILQFDRELFDYVRNDVSSFHASEERWLNPAQLSTNMSKKDMNRIRTGWDLILDIDTKHLEYAKICTELLSEALEFHNVRCHSVKFSGGTGFHIGVPFEAFPKEVNKTLVRELFPEAPQVIAAYLKKMIKKYLSERILETEGNITKISHRTGKKFDELVEKTDDGRFFNPYSVLEIDTIVIAPRHLFRMPYCFNEKTWLVSIPIRAKDIPVFDSKDAHPEKVEPELGFLDNIPKSAQAKQLIMQAFDWHNQEMTVEKDYKELTLPEQAIPQKYFPPCVKLILKGVKDGRKRSVFILINFLSSCGWGYKQIEQLLLEWNKRNPEPLKQNYIMSQLKYYKKSRARYLPPNCDNRNYYKDIGVCKPEELCRQIKNPVTYAMRKWKFQRGTRKRK